MVTKKWHWYFSSQLATKRRNSSSQLANEIFPNREPCVYMYRIIIILNKVDIDNNEVVTDICSDNSTNGN